MSLNSVSQSHADRHLRRPGPCRPRARGPPLSIAEATEIVGGLSRTSKMPSHSWGIPASHCRAGGKLLQIKGSTCHGCYALKGAYRWSTVEAAYQRRLERFDDPRWVDAMTVLVDWQARRNREPYFRWMDSGDLQSVGMLEKIAHVATATPDVSHWLPTREIAIVRRYRKSKSVPENLTIRLSAYFVDGEPPSRLGLPTSSVHKDQAPKGFECPAYEVKPATCGECRTCWDPKVPNVSYRFH